MEYAVGRFVIFILLTLGWIMGMFLLGGQNLDLACWDNVMVCNWDLTWETACTIMPLVLRYLYILSIRREMLQTHGFTAYEVSSGL